MSLNLKILEWDYTHLPEISFKQRLGYFNQDIKNSFEKIYDDLSNAPFILPLEHILVLTKVMYHEAAITNLRQELKEACEILHYQKTSSLLLGELFLEKTKFLGIILGDHQILSDLKIEEI